MVDCEHVVMDCKHSDITYVTLQSHDENNSDMIFRILSTVAQDFHNTGC